MPISPNIYIAPPSEQLYEVKYKPGGHSYSFKATTLLNRFGATQKDIDDGLKECETNNGQPIADGPLKNKIIRLMDTTEQLKVREDYRKKQEEIREVQEKIAAANQPMVQAIPVEYLPPYFLEVGDRARMRYEQYTKNDN